MQHHYRKKRKKGNLIQLVIQLIQLVPSSNENTLLNTETTDNDVTDNFSISNTEMLFEKRDTDSLNKNEIFDKNSMEKTLEKTQMYNMYYLGAETEETICKNTQRIWDNKIVKTGTCKTRDFNNANPMDPEQSLRNGAKYKYFI